MSIRTATEVDERVAYMRDLEQSYAASIQSSIDAVAADMKDRGFPAGIATKFAEFLVIQMLNAQARANWAG